MADTKMSNIEVAYRDKNGSEITSTYEVSPAVASKLKEEKLSGQNLATQLDMAARFDEMFHLNGVKLASSVAHKSDGSTVEYRNGTAVLTYRDKNGSEIASTYEVSPAVASRLNESKLSGQDLATQLDMAARFDKAFHLNGVKLVSSVAHKPHDHDAKPEQPTGKPCENVCDATSVSADQIMTGEIVHVRPAKPEQPVGPKHYGELNKVTPQQGAASAPRKQRAPGPAVP